MTEPYLAHFTRGKHASVCSCLIFPCWFSSLRSGNVFDIFLLGILLPLFIVKPRRRGIANNDMRENVSMVTGESFIIAWNITWVQLKLSKLTVSLALLPLVTSVFFSWYILAWYIWVLLMVKISNRIKTSCGAPL